jgi:hypothetical protein
MEAISTWPRAISPVVVPLGLLPLLVLEPLDLGEQGRDPLVDGGLLGCRGRRGLARDQVAVPLAAHAARGIEGLARPHVDDAASPRA